MTAVAGQGTTASASRADGSGGTRPRIALLSTSDTDLLSGRASRANFALANPSKMDVAGSLPGIIDDADVIIVRILGTARSWQTGMDMVSASGVPLIVLGGEQTPDAELMRLSSVPIGVAAQAHRYLTEGGPANLTQLHAFVSDTVLLTGEGFEAPTVLPSWGALPRPDLPELEVLRPKIGVLFYRAHQASGNTNFVHSLADAIDAAGGAGTPIFCSSLRGASPELLDELGTFDALIVTVLAAGGTKPATATAGGDDENWDVAALAALDIPILQGLCLTWSREAWASSNEGLTPLDVATQVAVPEFDGRIITVPFSFKETDSDGLPFYVADDERCSRVAGIALAHARLRHTRPADRKIALLLSAYPTKHARIGNAVGLDTPVSTIRLLRAMRDAGYDVGPADGPGSLPGLAPVEPVEGEDPDTTAGNALIHALIAAGGNDTLVGGGHSLLQGAAGLGTVMVASGGDTVVGADGSFIQGPTSGSGVAVVQAGAGAEAVFGGGGAMSVSGGSGTLHVQLGSGQTTVAGGSGTETILVQAASHATLIDGAGSEIVSLTAGLSARAMLTLSGFDPGKDQIMLDGYGAGAAQALAASQVSSASGTILTLSDGATITLLGLSHLASGALTGS